MSVAFLPLGAAIIGLHALPAVVRIVLAVLVVGGLWWGPFTYGMYLSMAAVKNGDRRLLKRGKAGTAVVLSANKTNEVIQSGGFAWEAPRVYKYRLRVTVPGHHPYETDCRICATGIRPGTVVNVAVSPLNRKRVTIDVGQGSKGGNGVPTPVPGARTFPVASTLPAGNYPAGNYPAGNHPAGRVDVASGVSPVTYTRPSSPDAQRISDLTQLGQLHSQGVLTDAEFAAEKARILGE
jgi:hypothetical protein